MIEINNLTTVAIDEEFLKGVVSGVLNGELDMSKYRNIELSIALIGSGRMRKLNKKYRGENRVTDVLAFPESEVTFEKFKIGPFKKVKGLGEIVICLREVRKNSKRFSTTLEKELANVLIHGLLHLLGYAHEKNEREAKKMQEKQKYYLTKIDAGYTMDIQ